MPVSIGSPETSKKNLRSSLSVVLDTMVKHRAFFLFALGTMSATLVLISMNHTHHAGIHTLVSETQHRLVNLRKRFEDESVLHVEDAYLEPLGLSTHDVRVFWPNSTWHTKFKNVTEPVILSAVPDGRMGEAINFVRNSRLFLPNLTVILYDLGLTRNERELLTKYCNSTQCAIKELDLAQFPRHVANLAIRAYRPLIIQKTLKDAGCVLWLDIDERLTTSDIQAYLQRAKDTSGVLTWLDPERKIPTSSMTHPKMFARLGISDLEDFNFQHMVELGALLIYYTPNVQAKLMEPWVRCALIDDCIQPIGAQSTGCRFDKKPQYRYSGCHAYDTSALNIILGQMFQFKESAYVDPEPFFVKMAEESEAEDPEGNGTTLPGDVRYPEGFSSPTNVNPSSSSQSSRMKRYHHHGD